MYAQYFQGAGGGALGYGPVAVGMRFTPRSDSIHRGVPPFGVQGNVYVVTALIPDPSGNPNVPGEYDNDQITLSGTVDTSTPSQWPNATATVSTEWLMNAYRIS